MGRRRACEGPWLPRMKQRVSSMSDSGGGRRGDSALYFGGERVRRPREGRGATPETRRERAGRDIVARNGRDRASGEGREHAMV